ncbi:MAG: VOC family protein [Caldilineaceae bacterium]
MLNFDHLIIAVRDLDAALADYRALGFTVYYGGKHTHKATHNGLIALADGSYLELLAPQNPAEIDQTIDVLAHGEGFGGYALLTADIDGDAARLRAAGIECGEPLPGHRDRYDGAQIQWRSTNVGGTRNPFLITDVTPHILRVPDDADKVTHANGAAGIVGLTVFVPDMGVALAKYGALLDARPVRNRRTADVHSVQFALGNCDLTLVQPLTATASGAQQVVRMGETIGHLHLRTSQAASAGLLDAELAHGASIELIV